MVFVSIEIGMRAPSRLGMAPPPLSRHRSEGGDDDHASILSGGEATPTAPFPMPSPTTYQSTPPRFRPPFRGRGGPRPFLSRGRSLEASSPMMGLTSSISFHSRPVTSSVATPMHYNANIMTTPTYYDYHAPLESMSAPEDAYTHSDHAPIYPRVLVSDSEARDVCPPLSEALGGVADKSRLMATPMRSSSGRRKLDSTFRNDSLSSDQSECLQRPPPPKPHKHKRHGHAPSHHKAYSGRPFGVSSSDEEIRSTPECTSCGEEEMESESVSEKGRLTKLEYYISKRNVNLSLMRFSGSLIMD